MIVHETAVVEAGAVIGPNVVIGARCHIASGTRIVDSTILADTKVHSNSYLQGSIIGWKNTIGQWVRITDLTCTAEDVQIANLTCLKTVKVLPHKGVSGEHKDSIIM